MYHIKTESYDSQEPLYTKLRDGDGTLFIPEARVAKDYFRSGIYERGYIDWARDNFAREDKDVIDIGAHIGMYTVELGKKAKHVHSFECSPKSFNYLCANIALRNLHYKVTKYNCALSDEEGSTKYYIRDPHDGGGNGISGFDIDIEKNIPTIDVPMKALDSFGLTNVNFIKIDVEGHEEFVLRGAVKTLEENNYPKILFESWPERYEESGKVPSKLLRKNLFDFIESLEYKIIQVNGGTDDMFLAERNSL
jgi:FkbM family methyltransferase